MSVLLKVYKKKKSLPLYIHAALHTLIIFFCQEQISSINEQEEYNLPETALVQ